MTPAQSHAVRRRAGSLLLEAGAGSGKTSVLVERFVRCVLEDGVAPARILAITFTDKAAGELRARVRERFLELGRRDAAHDAQTAWVSTIHGFCARLLRGHAVAAGLDPAFVVLDEATARELRDAAWDTAFGRFLDGPRGTAALDLAAGYGADRLRTAIERVHDALRSAGHTRPRLPRVAAAVEDPAALRAELAAARDAAAAELDVAAGANGIGVQVVRARDALERCRDLLASPATGGPAAGRALAGVRFGGSAAALRGDACARYLSAHAAYATACRDREAEVAVESLDELLGHCADAYAAVKRSRAALDFDDLELIARDLLAGDDELRRSYAARFERIMVDEFQDSNPLQLELFEALHRDNLFLVGDERQSIYGFRHADVEVFRRRRDALAASDRVARLEANFRTRGPILDTLNATFAPRFGAGFVPLREGRDAALEPSDEPLVELLLTDRRGWDDADRAVDLGDLPRAAAWRHAEARLLAQRVHDLIADGRAQPEDVVVLLRSLGDLPVYERALEDQGLLTLSVGGRGYWGRQVVRDLSAWLAALANPRDEVALYGVLASPLTGLSSDALALVARAGSGSVWRSIEAGGGPLDELEPDDRARLDAFRDRFAAERRLAPRLALDELLRRVVDATGYDLHVLSLPGGARRLANVHKLLRMAADYERDHGRDVRGLVDRATAELEAEAREADAPVELGDVKAVRLMTIHAAKGLEFDVVCVADLGRRGAGDDQDDLLVDGGEVGLRLVGLDGFSQPALAFQRLRERARERAAREEERIAYVALTRARERLVLSGAVDVDRWPQEGPGAPPLSWLGPALLGGDLRRLPTTAAPVRDVSWTPAEGPGEEFPARLRCLLNRPETVGRVLRDASRAPAGASLPSAPAPSPAPAVAPPPGAPPTVRALSYSALALWRSCGYRFYLQRMLRLPDEPADAPGRAVEGAPGLDLRLRGTIVHGLLEEETLVDGGRSAGGDPLERAAAAARRHGAAVRDEEVQDIARLVGAFGRSPLRARLARARAVRREHGFAFGLAGTLLTGVVDVLADEPGGRQLVVDYKTDRIEPDTDLEALAEDRYGVQRRVYALAALREGASRVEVAHVFLERPEQPACATFVPADAERLHDELVQRASGLLEGRYPVSERPHRDLCVTCPGRRALCSHPSELTLRELPRG